MPQHCLCMFLHAAMTCKLTVVKHYGLCWTVQTTRMEDDEAEVSCFGCVCELQWHALDSEFAVVQGLVKSEQLG